jgi:xylan 1,4-beta-xylosidase
MKPLFSIFLFFISVYNSFSQLVLPGDNPDPSVVKVGDTYWATATTSNWMPAYPIYKSRDLIHWDTQGFVFEKKPDWADYYFWAPEISYDKGKYYVYYAAHKKGGNLCLGIASSPKPEGPYKDHGALMCQEAGSIDAFPIRDENGKLYLIWKEDLNSINKPTPIWAMEMNEERTALMGEKKELFRNDVPWEANLVEGVSVIRHGQYYYALYAGAGCCGSACTYGIGVARAKNILGPWEKYSKNPILTSDEDWKCLGHGTPIEKNGKYYFMFHGYNAKSTVYTGREGLLKEFVFTDEDWVEFSDEKVKTPDLIPKTIKENFDGKAMNWQWSVFQEPKFTFNKGKLELNALSETSGAFIAHKTFTPNYSAQITLLPLQTTAQAGLGLIGDDNNLIAVYVVGTRIELMKLKDKKLTKWGEKEWSGKGNLILKMDVMYGKLLSFSFSSDGKNFQTVNEKSIDGEYLPPWDRAVRIGVFSKGAPSKKAVFEKFVLENKK